MGIYLWIFLGALAGWVTSLILMIDTQGALLKIFVGAVGAIIWAAGLSVGSISFSQSQQN